MILISIVSLGEGWYILNQQGQIEELSFRISSLQYQSIALSTRCTVLETNMSAITEELEEEIKILEKQYVQLEIIYDYLENENTQLVYSLENTRIERDNLQADLEEYFTRFKRLKGEINSRVALDGNYSRFVMPQDPDVSDWTFEITGGFTDPDSMVELLEDYQALYDWIEIQIEDVADSAYPYVYADPSISVRWIRHSVRYPNETLVESMGDCEDQAILLLSMMASHNDLYDKWCITLDWEGGGHVAVAFPIGTTEIVILDPTKDYTSIPSDASPAETAEEAIEAWMGLFEEEGIYVSGIFDEDEYQEFVNTTEFLDWFESNYGS
ncbi:MAG: hypothetical protein PVH79_01205 [Candidatus Bathyarchaeota archaeon]|jgi:hypothetical protein